MIHPIQEKLLELSKKENLAKLSLREMAERIGMPKNSPQKIKHHLLQLQKKGFINIDRIKGVTGLASSTPGWAKGLFDKTARLFSIPIVGTANCGPATIFAEPNFQGFLRVSNKLVDRSKPNGLFAIKADGSSMNKAEIKGRNIEDGDYVIVNSDDKEAKNGNIVLVIIDGRATIKRFIDDRENGQFVLKADSSFDYDPIYLHHDDNFNISGKVIAIIKKPKPN
ncbi:MAG: S24 family peptidase [Candidatus Staskawiczbacteria bacterium]|jgi:repressor LexA